jgi:hypothetical protein
MVLARVSMFRQFHELLLISSDAVYAAWLDQSEANISCE